LPNQPVVGFKCLYFLALLCHESWGMRFQFQLGEQYEHAVSAGADVIFKNLFGQGVLPQFPFQAISNETLVNL